jgi:hypothetical protein
MHMEHVRVSTVPEHVALDMVEELRQREHLLYGFGARCETPKNVVRPGFGSAAPRRSAIRYDS